MPRAEHLELGCPRDHVRDGASSSDHPPDLHALGSQIRPGRGRPHDRNALLRHRRNLRDLAVVRGLACVQQPVAQPVCAERQRHGAGLQIQQLDPWGDHPGGWKLPLTVEESYGEMRSRSTTAPPPRTGISTTGCPVLPGGIHAFGTPLPGWPISVVGCGGVAVDSTGHPWFCEYFNSGYGQYTPAGNQVNFFSQARPPLNGFGGSYIAFDTSHNDDLYVMASEIADEGPGVYKFFGASKYNEYNLIDVSGIFDRERTLAVDSAGGKLYVGHSNFSSGHIKVFDTITEEQVEDIPVPGTPTGVVVDETTGTLFVSSSNKVREFPPVIIPDVIRGTEDQHRSHDGQSGRQSRSGRRHSGHRLLLRVRARSRQLHVRAHTLRTGSHARRTL